MKKISSKRPGVKVKTTVKAGGHSENHNRALKVRSTVKAGGVKLNHNRAAR